MKMKRSLDLYRFRTLAVLLARNATAAMTFASIAFGLILAVGTAFAAVDGFDAKGLAFAHEGFGVRRNFYQSGRISAKVSDIAGLFELNYVGAQPFTKQTFYQSAAENCHWMHGFDPYVLIDDVPYRLTFANTKHYPFGYTSECTVDGVKLRHEFVLDRNVAFRRITVLENPKGKSVRCRIVQMQAGMGQGARWKMERAALRAEAKFDGGAKVALEIGSMNPVSFPLNDRPPQPLAYRHGDGRPDFRFDMDETEPGGRHLFWWAFDAKDDEDLSETRVDRVFAEFRERQAADARFETGDALVDGWLGYVAPMSAAHEVDGIGAFRASPTYWVWGWDAMVHAGTLAVFDAARETFAQNAVDVFTDCPSRERAGWLCDSFFIARVSRLLTGSLALEDLFLDNYARAESFDIADGMLPMCYPGDHVNGNYIPNWAMWLVLELDEYARRGGDARLVASFRPRLEKLLAFLWRYRNADGLLEKLPGWVFVEWSQANKWVQDVNYPSNMLWAETLDALDRLYGRPDLAAEATRVRETVRRQSWDGQWFRDHAVRQSDGTLAVVPDDISETCQYYAFFFKVATPKTHPALWRTLVEAFGPSRLDADKKPLAHPQIAPSNAFIGNYLRLECLSRAGLSEKVLAECRSYFAAMAAQTGTLWEFDKPTHSCCHGFASHAAVLLVRDILGVKKIDYAARTVVFEPPPQSPLAFCEVALPTDEGDLEIGWRHPENGAVTPVVRLPDGWRVQNLSNTHE